MELTMWSVTDDYMALCECNLGVCGSDHCICECECECIEYSTNVECNLLLKKNNPKIH